MEVGGARPRAFSPEGVVGFRILTPDGRNVVGKFKDALWLFPLSGGEPTALNGVHGNEWIAALSADGRFAYVYEPLGWPIGVSRVDLRSGERVHFRDFGAADRAGMGSWRSTVSMTPDGRSAIYSYTRETSTLYLVEGLR